MKKHIGRVSIILSLCGMGQMLAQTPEESSNYVRISEYSEQKGWQLEKHCSRWENKIRLETRTYYRKIGPGLEIHILELKNDSIVGRQISPFGHLTQSQLNSND